MSVYRVTGGRKLNGQVTAQGAKNSVLPILAATLLAPGCSVISNCPDLSDVAVTLEILTLLGCRVERMGDTVAIDASALSRAEIPPRLMREMRSSVIFLGALLARSGTAELSYPGGCELGPRPINLHLSALRALGAEIGEDQGCLRCRGGAAMRGGTFRLPLPSVGATENVMLAAVSCPGTTTIVGAAQEPEIVDLQNFLRAMGVRVSGAGGPVITVEGNRTLPHPARYTVMGDRIAAATYLCAVGATGGQVEVQGVEPEHLTAVTDCLQAAGCRVHTAPKRISLTSSGRLKGIAPVRTAPYPGFPTDAQALLMAALAGGTGSTTFVETIFDSRYRHVEPLRRMGADIRLSGRTAVVYGTGGLHGAAVHGGDLRAAAALVTAALAAQGESRISGLEHIRRGYDGLDRNLRALGGDITEEP